MLHYIGPDSFPIQALIYVALPWGDKRFSSDTKLTAIRRVTCEGWSYTRAAAACGAPTKSVIHWVSDFENRLSSVGVSILRIQTHNPRNNDEDDHGDYGEGFTPSSVPL